MRRYEIAEVPYGWRIVEYSSNGANFHARLYHSHEDAQRHVDNLAAKQRRVTAVTDARRRALNRCECRGECGHQHPGERCKWHHGEVLAGMPGSVSLTVLPLDHDPDNLDVGNLRAYCQLCRQRYDADERNTDALFEIG